MAYSGASAARPISSVLVGAAVGLVVVAGSLLVLSPPVPPLQYSVTYQGFGPSPYLGCAPEQCASVSFGFSGPATLDPSLLRIALTPLNGSVQINNSPGAPDNLVYSGSSVVWWSDRGGGNFSEPVAGTFQNPNGKPVGPGGAGSIDPGARFVLLGPVCPCLVEPYWLTFSYQGTNVTLLVAVG